VLEYDVGIHELMNNLLLLMPLGSNPHQKTAFSQRGLHPFQQISWRAIDLSFFHIPTHSNCHDERLSPAEQSHQDGFLCSSAALPILTLWRKHSSCHLRSQELSHHSSSMFCQVLFQYSHDFHPFWFGERLERFQLLASSARLVRTQSVPV
jgi:hypothetical protein